ncbi:hypothetical protein BWGOE8_09030 [Bacillus mycoides]|uniref:Uncharacterized protein n=1 Tax=Bacillus mycoides TaxID=1405 RepID=A0A1E8BCW2_BACMY|nr:hypothetical protein BWGOE9_08870 [Bacillus mycoides]OFD84117.1 hypothetical protein BWGOE8_09030 [Bacillus mycoides]OFD86308.1 hypothetical protein BWGOE10_08950 [Bacillus mycoides]
MKPFKESVLNFKYIIAVLLYSVKTMEKKREKQHHEYRITFR